MNYAAALELVRDLLTDRISNQAEQIAAALGYEPDTATAPPDVTESLDLPTVVSRAFHRSHDGTTCTLAPWAGVEQLAALAEQHRRETAPAPASESLQCPQWCDRADNHPFDRAYGPGAPARRDHVHRFSDRASCATLQLIERTPDPARGPSDLRLDSDALTISVHYSGGGVGYLTGDGARRLAAQLLDAADLYDTEAANIAI